MLLSLYSAMINYFFYALNVIFLQREFLSTCAEEGVDCFQPFNSVLSKISESIIKVFKILNLLILFNRNFDFFKKISTSDLYFLFFFLLVLCSSAFQSVFLWHWTSDIFERDWRQALISKFLFRYLRPPISIPFRSFMQRL